MATARADTPPRSNQYPIPDRMKAWVLGGPEELSLVEKPVPQPGPAEVLVRIDAIAVCATDIEIIRHGVPAMIDGGLPFNRGFTPGHEYMGTVAGREAAIERRSEEHTSELQSRFELVGRRLLDKKANHGGPDGGFWLRCRWSASMSPG